MAVAPMAVAPELLIKNLFVETYRHKGLVVAGFVLFNVVAVILGLTLAKSYVSSTTIFVEEKNIIQPLMLGAAVATDVTERSRIAKEILFGSRIMNQILEDAGWTQGSPSDVEKERLVEEIKKRTSVLNVGPKLIKVEYRDVNPQRAYLTTQKYAELFLSESVRNQTKESYEAYAFIDNQVNEYHAKLIETEQKLKELRSTNVDARPGTEAEIAGRINALQGTIERTTLEIKEAQIKQASLEKQLSGEAEVSISMTREGQNMGRIAELQTHLDILRLSYHETYPDIVRLRHQIEDLKESVTYEQQQREVAGREARKSNQIHVDESLRVNPLYTQLKRELFETKTNIETLTTRLNETRHLLQSELNRARRVHAGEATLAEYTRDYEVNRDIYQDLLRRRENARVSKNLNRDQQGLTFKIHEPAALPLRPSGLGFMHFVLGGLILGTLLPVVAIIAFQQIDPRVRFPALVSERLKLPVLATVPHLISPVEIKQSSTKMKRYVVVVLLTLGFVSTVSALKYLEII
jgi:polysaccharide chain length determinant protein (PEP-CTERM system associated)